MVGESIAEEGKAGKEAKDSPEVSPETVRMTKQLMQIIPAKIPNSIAKQSKELHRCGSEMI